MADGGDITIRIRAIDEATPVLRRVSRRLWWFRHERALSMICAGWVGSAVMALMDGHPGAVITLPLGIVAFAIVNWKASA